MRGAAALPMRLRILQGAAIAYLLVLPFGQLWVSPVVGATAALSDVWLAVLVVVALATGGREMVDPRGRNVHLGVFVLLLFAAWVAVTGLWGYLFGYTMVKAAGYAGLALGVLAIAVSGLGWKQAAGAWLLGAAVSVAMTFFGAFLGPEVLRERVVYAGSVFGLPFPRLQGSFYHPNLFGQYLVVSGAILWGVWPTLVAEKGGRWAGWIGAAALAFALFLSASTAWLAAGILLIGWGRVWGRGARSAGGVAARTGGRLAPWALRLGGAALAALTLAGLLGSLAIEAGGVVVRSSGIRPDIWASAVDTFLSRPILGRGAAPTVAQAADPLLSDALVGWDAHSLYLSLLAQFGLVGGVLFFTGVGFIVGSLWRYPRTRARAALLAAFLALAVDGLMNAGEDFRHAWALLGIAGMVVMGERWWADADRTGDGRTEAASR